MGFLDDGLFDFDGNGRTTEDEEFAAIATLAFLKAQDEQNKRDISRNTQRYVPARSSPKPASSPQSTTATSTEKQDEAVRHVRRRGRTGWIVIGVVAAIIAIFVFSSLVKSAKKEAAYHKAETLIAQEDYSGALQLLGKMDPSYQDVKPLTTLCEAHLLYDRDCVTDAYYTLKGVRFYHQTSEQKKKIDAFWDELQKEYDAYLKAQAEEYQAEYERVQALPFPSVGQYVTSAQYEHLTYRKGDLQTFSEPTKVYYYSDGENGYDLWISEYNKILLIKEARPPSGKTGKSSSHAFDPDVDGFTDPDDFYDWYKDDFSDYEDAEEYYYDHGGE